MSRVRVSITATSFFSSLLSKSVPSPSTTPASAAPPTLKVFSAVSVFGSMTVMVLLLPLMLKMFLEAGS